MTSVDRDYLVGGWVWNPVTTINALESSFPWISINRHKSEQVNVSMNQY